MPNTPQTFTDAQRLDFVLANMIYFRVSKPFPSSREEVNVFIEARINGSPRQAQYVLPDSCKPSMCDATYDGKRCHKLTAHDGLHVHSGESVRIEWSNPTSAESPAPQCGNLMLDPVTWPRVGVCTKPRGHTGNHGDRVNEWANQAGGMWSCNDPSPDKRYLCELTPGHPGRHQRVIPTAFNTQTFSWDDEGSYNNDVTT